MTEVDPNQRWNGEVRRPPPATDSLGFDPRLMDAERLLQLAGRAPLVLGEMHGNVRTLDCQQCGRSVDILTDETGATYTTNPLQIATAALRHQVMRHDLSLSGGNNE
jgi:hypothetical protein